MTDTPTCRGCGADFGTPHFKACPYWHPWPRDRVDTVQTRIEPVAARSLAPREEQA